MVIGISGRLGSGKDTVGEIIQYLTGVDANGKFTKGLNWSHTSSFEVKKFAGMLKYFASRLTGIPVEYFEDQDFKKTVLPPCWDTYGIRFVYPGGLEDANLYGSFATIEEAVEFERKERKALQWGSDLKTRIDSKQMTVREFLQVLGTEAMRDGLHTNVWVNGLFADYKAMPNKTMDESFMEQFVTGSSAIRYTYPNWIITDMRFPNEIAAVELREGITIRVNRDAAIKVQHSGKGDDFTIEKFDKNNPKHVALKAGQDKMLHPSETALDDSKFDYVIENDGTLDELVEKVRAILIREKIIS
jgi:hypothetical protein